MNANEWKTWREHFATSFPDVWAKIAETGTAAATMEQWRRSLGSLELTDARTAVDMVVDGKTPQPMRWSEFPALIGRLARGVASGRAKAAVKQTGPPVKGKHSMIAMLECVQSSVKAGLSQTEALKELDKRFPIADADYRPVRCRDCNDSGTVDTWAAESINCLLFDVPLKRYRAAVLCSCTAGHKRQADPPEPHFRYSIEFCCPWRSGDESLLREWVADYKARRTKRMPNYQPAFDAFGGQDDE